jgi:hypothetical protein
MGHTNEVINGGDGADEPDSTALKNYSSSISAA